MANEDFDTETETKKKKISRSKRGFVKPDKSFVSDFEDGVVAAYFGCLGTDEKTVIKEWIVAPQDVTFPDGTSALRLTAKQDMGIYGMGVWTKFGNEGNTVWNDKSLADDKKTPQHGADNIQAYIDSGEHAKERGGSRVNLDKLMQACLETGATTAEAADSLRACFEADPELVKTVMQTEETLNAYNRLMAKTVNTMDATKAALAAAIAKAKAA